MSTDDDVNESILWLHENADRQFTDYLNLLSRYMGSWWDRDEAQSEIVRSFVEEYGEIDRVIEAAREEGDYEEQPLLFVWTENRATLRRATCGVGAYGIDDVFEDCGVTASSIIQGVPVCDAHLHLAPLNHENGGQS
jgi:hypothetical protein